jgi:hypothetical protein
MRTEQISCASSAWLYVTLDGVVEAPENRVMPDEQMSVVRPRADQTGREIDR